MKLWPADVVYGVDGQHPGPYLTRYPLHPKTRWGQLCLHVFHRQDDDPDPHDHARDFWTMPLSSSYTEETFDPANGAFAFENVQRWRWHFRRAEHCHRITSSWNRVDVSDMHGAPADMFRRVWPLVTLVWFFPRRREWGFWVTKDHPKAHWVSKAPGQKHVWTSGRGSSRGWLHWQAYCYPERYE